MRRIIPITAALALILRAGPALAAEGELPRLYVHRTEDASTCPDARALAALVAQHTKRPALAPAETSRGALAVQMYRSEGGLTAVIQSGTKTRTLTDRGPDCAGLGEALAVTIAILLDEDPVPPPPPALDPAPRSLAPEPPRSEPPKVEPLKVEPPPSLPEVPRYHLSIALGGRFTEGVMLPAAPGISGEIELRIGRLVSVSAGAFGLVRQAITAWQVPGASVDIRFGAGFARLCFTLFGNADAERLAACAAPMVGAIYAEGSGFPVSRSGTAPWVAAGASVVYQRRVIGPLTVGTRVEMMVPLLRQDIQISPDVPVFSPSAAGVALDVEVRVKIW